MYLIMQLPIGSICCCCLSLVNVYYPIFLTCGFLLSRDVNKFCPVEKITLRLQFIVLLNTNSVQFSSVQFSHSVVYDSLRTHGPQHTRPPGTSPTPRVYSHSSPLSQWCHTTISSSVVPFPTCPQSFPASGSFQISQLFTSGGQNIGVSASTSVLPVNIQDWAPLGWTGWISL